MFAYIIDVFIYYSVKAVDMLDTVGVNQTIKS